MKTKEITGYFCEDCGTIIGFIERPQGLFSMIDKSWGVTDDNRDLCGECLGVYLANKMKNYYFTFGDDRLRKYVKIVAKSYSSARERMLMECGRRWSHQYTEDEFDEIKSGYETYPLFTFVEEE